MTKLGSGDFVYEELAEWAKLPDGWGFKEVVDVVVDSQTGSMPLIGVSIH